MCLWTVPVLTKTLEEEQREEEEKRKNLLSILMMISTYALLMEMYVEDHGDAGGVMQVETEVVDAVFSNWPQEQGAAATELLDLFLVHGVELGVARLKVTELFSPPRPTALPRAVPDFSAFAPGSIFDLRCDRGGLALDFLRADHRRAVRLRIKEEEPHLVVGSPPCIKFKDLFQNLRAHKVDPQVVRQRRIEAEILLRFACEIFEMQKAMEKHFLHEHTAGADSWKTLWVHSLLQDLRVAEVNVHQCVYGCTIKPTRFISSAWALLEHLSRGCSRDHGHQTAVERGHVTVAAEYTGRLSKAVLCGIDAQRLREGRGPPQPAVRSLRLGPMKVDCAILQDHVKDEEEELQEFGSFAESVHDELAGEPLQASLVWGAREEECAFMENWGVWKRFLCRSAGGGRAKTHWDPVG